MQVLEIHDTVHGSFLAVDLKDILHALGELALNSNWKIGDSELGSGESIDAFGEGWPELKKLCNDGGWIDGKSLREIADRIVLTIWGDFVGYEPDSDRKWILISAVDGGFFEVHTENEVALDIIAKSFKDVRRPIAR